MNRINMKILSVIDIFAFVVVLRFSATAQSSQTTPLTSHEVVTLVYQLPKHPELRDDVVEEIRKRGIGFPLTDGMRSLVATKSGSDALLRRTPRRGRTTQSQPNCLGAAARCGS